MDFDRIGLLLHIVEKLTGHPKYKNILAAATTELDEYNEGKPAMQEPQGTEEDTSEETEETPAEKPTTRRV